MALRIISKTRINFIGTYSNYQIALIRKYLNEVYKGMTLSVEKDDNFYYVYSFDKEITNFYFSEIISSLNNWKDL